MDKDPRSFAGLLRADINSVNGFAANGVDSFETNVNNSLDNWLEWNPAVNPADEAVQAVRDTSAALANCLRQAGLLAMKEKVERFRGAALDAVNLLEKRFPAECAS